MEIRYCSTLLLTLEIASHFSFRVLAFVNYEQHSKAMHVESELFMSLVNFLIVISYYGLRSSL